MPKENLSVDAILDTTTEVIRRYGPDKTSVVDVAKELKVTHGSLYRYFPDKAVLFDAVIQRWLDELSQPLPLIADKQTAADMRLKEWLMMLINIKQSTAKKDPEMFAKYYQIAEGTHKVIAKHIKDMVGQVAQIIEDGNNTGIFRVNNPGKTAESIIHATAYYHHPYHVLQQLDQPIEDEADQLVELTIAGIRQ